MDKIDRALFGLSKKKAEWRSESHSGIGLMLYVYGFDAVLQ